MMKVVRKSSHPIVVEEMKVEEYDREEVPCWSESCDSALDGLHPVLGL